MNKSIFQSRSAAIAVYLMAGSFSVALFLKNAWVAEDAFIILRSVDQFLHGNGFRWNPHERVQVFTSPLWYLLILASTVFCKTLYLNLVALSLLLHVALLRLTATLFGNVWRWLCAVLLLTLSQAFFDFTASGLEYPLIYLLLAAFVLLFLRDQPVTDRYWLAITGGLALVTRHDLLFILAPMLLHLAWRYRNTLERREALKIAGLFLLPLTAWTLFSLAYYGLPFPNTAYAKLGITGVSRMERLGRGLIYLGVSLKTDPITPLLIGISIVNALRTSLGTYRWVGVSLLLALAYILWIGADYMAGRFFAPLYLVAVLCLCAFPWQQPLSSRVLGIAIAVAGSQLVYYTLTTNLESIGQLFAWLGLSQPGINTMLGILAALCLLLIAGGIAGIKARRAVAVVSAIMLGASTQQHDSPWQTGYRDWGKATDFDMWWNLNNVSRERYFIYHWTSLYAWRYRDPTQPFPDHPWCHEGIAMPQIAIVSFDGLIPYCMGTERIAIDIKALTDPLLPRMQKSPDAFWTSGGVNRVMPAGYQQSVQDGINRIEDPDLARYYDKLLILTRSEPLFTTERMKTVVAFNFGLYEPWRLQYIERQTAKKSLSPKNPQP